MITRIFLIALVCGTIIAGLAFVVSQIDTSTKQAQVPESLGRNTTCLGNEDVGYRTENVTIYRIGSCEYVFFDRSLTHKGDCTNAIHIYK